jgi:hypothetical protein
MTERISDQFPVKGSGAVHSERTWWQAFRATRFESVARPLPSSRRVPVLLGEDYIAKSTGPYERKPSIGESL